MEEKRLTDGQVQALCGMTVEVARELGGAGAAEKARRDLFMDAHMAYCVKDYRMNNGPVAFRKGTFYEWRFATDEEQNDTQCDYAFKSELGPDHFMNHTDVTWFFGSPDEK